MKKLLFTIILTVCSSPLFASFDMNNPNFQIPSMPSAPGQGQIGMPSDTELAEVTKYLEDLQNNNPEQLKELERMGHELIASLNPDELNEFSAMFGVDPEELRQEAESFLAQGSEPNEPLEQPERFAEHPIKKTTEATKKSTPPQASAKEGENTKNIIRKTIATLNSLRAKGAASPLIESHLRTWDDDLTLLLFYLNTINKKEHFLKLPSEEKGKKITKALQDIEEKLSRALPLIDTSIEDKIPNEYAFFNFTKNPTNKELEEAFEKKLAEHDPKKIEAQLKKEGKNAQAITREIKLARIAQSTIEDEYERLSDPKNRAELQKQELKIKQEIEEAHKNWSLLLTSITKEFGNAFFEQELLANLEGYLMAHEPIELKKKKEREKAIKDQEKIQKKRAKTKPEKTKGGSFEPRISYAKTPRRTSNNYASSSYGGGSYAPSSSYDFDDFSNFNSSPSQRSSRSSGGSSSSPSTTSPQYTDSGIESNLAQTARSIGEKTPQKELKKTMNDFASGYRKTEELFTKAIAGITENTSAQEKKQKLTAFLQKEDAVQLVTNTDRLANTTEQLTKLASKNNALKKELKNFFTTTIGKKGIGTTATTLFNEEKTGLKDKPLVKAINTNLEKIKELLKPFIENE